MAKPQNPATHGEHVGPDTQWSEPRVSLHGGGSYQPATGWWQLKYFLFSSLLGETIQIDSYFSDVLKPPTRLFWFAL